MKKQNQELFCVEKMGMKACASKCKHNAPPANRQTNSNTPTPSKLSEPLTIIWTRQTVLDDCSFSVFFIEISCLTCFSLIHPLGEPKNVSLKKREKTRSNLQNWLYACNIMQDYSLVLWSISVATSFTYLPSCCT